MPVVAKHEPGTPSFVDVSSPDLDAALEFYASLFGWEAVEAGDPEQTGGYRMLLLDGRVVAGAMPTQEQGQPPAWTTYVTVESVEETAEKVAAAGGAVIMEPIDVMTAGRMALFSDPAGAAFAVWEPKESIGSEVVNEPGSLAWNELRTRDPEGAGRFYSQVFGWDPMPFGEMEGYTVWTIGGHAPENGKGGMIDMAVTEIPDEVPPHWDVTFAVEDVDAAAARCAELGGAVVVEPMDIAVGRMAGLQDPTGAMFTVIRSDPGSQG